MMIHHKCHCGQTEVWISGLSPEPCCPCKNCGTVPGGADPIPHKYVKMFSEYTDKSYERCSICHRVKPDEEEEE